jgi:hypothetical protein
VVVVQWNRQDWDEANRSGIWNGNPLSVFEVVVMGRDASRSRSLRAASRAEASSAAREEVRARDRAAKRRRLSTNQNNRVVRTETLRGASLNETISRLDETLEIEPTREERKEEIYDACRERMSNEYLEEVVCCVCDCYHCVRDVVKKKFEDGTLLDRMKARLNPPVGLPRPLLDPYDVSNLVPALTGILLSKVGVDSAGAVVSGVFCRPCYNSLMTERVKGPPKFAVANGRFIGVLPSQFKDSTLTESAMLNLGQSTHCMSVVRGGQHKTIRSHSYVFRATPSPPSTMIPRDVVAQGVVSVRMVGSMTSRQKAAVMKKYTVRTMRLKTQGEWYTRHNRLFSTMGVRLSFGEGGSRDAGGTCVLA